MLLDYCKVRKKQEDGENWTRSEDEDDEGHLLDLLDTFLTSCSDSSRRISGGHVTQEPEGLTLRVSSQLKLKVSVTSFHSHPPVTFQNKMHFFKPKV